MITIKKWLKSALPSDLTQRKRKANTIMIVGMHRSGTSFLTGSLQQAGLELGKHSEWNPHNIRGNRENIDIVNFHDRILNARGFAWNRPPDGSITWSQDEVEEGRAFIQGYDGIPCWGFKDPRALLLVEGWLALIPDLRFVGIFRHPIAVAQSFASREGMAQDKAFSLWAHYNERLLKLYEHQPFPVLCFDEDDEILLTKLKSATSKLGLPGPKCEEQFYSSDLKHHKISKDSLPLELSNLYGKLKGIAL